MNKETLVCENCGKELYLFKGLELKDTEHPRIICTECWDAVIEEECKCYWGK